MTANVIRVVPSNKRCLWNSLKYYHRRNKQSFSLSNLPKLIVRDIAGPFLESSQGKQNISATTNCYSKLMLSIGISKTAVAHTANPFMNHRLILYGISAHLDIDSKTQIVDTFIAIMRTLHGVKQLQSATYHTQTNDQAEIFNKTIFVCLQHYVTEY